MYSSRLSPLSVVSCIEMVSAVNPSLNFFSIYYTHPIIGKPNLIFILDTTRLNHLLSYLSRFSRFDPFSPSAMHYSSPTTDNGPLTTDNLELTALAPAK